MKGALGARFAKLFKANTETTDPELLAIKDIASEAPITISSEAKPFFSTKKGLIAKGIIVFVGVLFLCLAYTLYVFFYKTENEGKGTKNKKHIDRSYKDHLEREQDQYEEDDTVIRGKGYQPPPEKKARDPARGWNYDQMMWNKDAQSRVAKYVDYLIGMKQFVVAPDPQTTISTNIDKEHRIDLHDVLGYENFYVRVGPRIIQVNNNNHAAVERAMIALLQQYRKAYDSNGYDLQVKVNPTQPFRYLNMPAQTSANEGAIGFSVFSDLVEIFGPVSEGLSSTLPQQTALKAMHGIHLDTGKREIMPTEEVIAYESILFKKPLLVTNEGLHGGHWFQFEKCIAAVHMYRNPIHGSLMNGFFLNVPKWNNNFVPFVVPSHGVRTIANLDSDTPAKYLESCRFNFEAFTVDRPLDIAVCKSTFVGLQHQTMPAPLRAHDFGEANVWTGIGFIYCKYPLSQTDVTKFELRISIGVVTWTRGYILTHSIPTEQGWSGCPILDTQGYVLGMHLRTSHAMNEGVGIDLLISKLQDFVPLQNQGLDYDIVGFPDPAPLPDSPEDKSAVIQSCVKDPLLFTNEGLGSAGYGPDKKYNCFYESVHPKYKDLLHRILPEGSLKMPHFAGKKELQFKYKFIECIDDLPIPYRAPAVLEAFYPIATVEYKGQDYKKFVKDDPVLKNLHEEVKLAEFATMQTHDLAKPNIDSIMKDSLKYCRLKLFDVDADAYQRTTDLFEAYLDDVYPSPMTPMSLPDAISSIDKTKSPGYPAKIKYFTKGEYLSKCSDVFAGLLHNIQHGGANCNEIIDVAGKEELRPILKIAENKIRSINSVPCNVMLLEKMLWGNMLAYLNERPFPIKRNMIGVSPFKGGFEAMILWLCHYYDLPKTNESYYLLSDIDFSQYDSSIPYEMTKDITNSWFARLKFSNPTSSALYHAIFSWLLDNFYLARVQMTIVAEGVAILGVVFGGNPSGGLITIVLNCAVNEKLEIYVNTVIFSDQHFTWNTYRDLLRNMTNGDDKMKSISSKLLLTKYRQAYDTGGPWSDSEIEDDSQMYALEDYENDYVKEITRIGFIMTMEKSAHRVSSTGFWRHISNMEFEVEFSGMELVYTNGKIHFRPDNGKLLSTLHILRRSSNMRDLCMKLNSLFIMNMFGNASIQLLIYAMRERVEEILELSQNPLDKQLPASMHSWKQALMLHFPDNECVVMDIKCAQGSFMEEINQMLRRNGPHMYPKCYGTDKSIFNGDYVQNAAAVFMGGRSNLVSMGEYKLVNVHDMIDAMDPEHSGSEEEDPEPPTRANIRLQPNGTYAQTLNDGSIRVHDHLPADCEPDGSFGDPD